MFNIRDKLFYIWLLLLPFSWVIATLANITAPDKLLAPVLMLLGIIGVFGSPSARRSNRVFFLIFVVIFFIIIKHLSFIGSNELFWQLILDDAIKVGYFLIPVFCIDDIKKFRISGWLVLLVAMSGCFSVFLVSTGLMTLPLERFEDSRLGVEGLLKAIGLFPSYGDLAQYIAFTVLLVIIAPGVKNRKNKWLFYARVLVFVGVILGLLGTQSRNIFISLFVSLGTLWFLKKLSSKQGVSKDTMMMIVVVVSFVGISLIGVFISNFIDTLSSFGGTNAKNTAGARLEQYAAAWEIMKTSPLMGADIETYMRLGPLIEGIHNVWLRLIAQGGLLAMLMMAALLWFCFKGIRSASRIPEKTPETMIATGYFAALMVSVMFYTGMGEMFWALLGVATSISCIPPFVKSNNEATDNDDVINENDSAVKTYSRYPQLR